MVFHHIAIAICVIITINYLHHIHTHIRIIAIAIIDPKLKTETTNLILSVFVHPHHIPNPIISNSPLIYPFQKSFHFPSRCSIF